jgi:hypothetical protein
MRILTTHLTRMKPGFICAAGLDAKGRHVRPVLRRAQLETSLLRSEGGCFDIGAVVELGTVQDVGSAPELEDREFDPAVASLVKMMDPGEVWTRLDGVAQPALASIFGSDLEIEGHSATVPLRRGIASLGVLRPAAPPDIRVDRYGKVRMQFTDGTFDLDLSVTDLRLFEEGWTSPNSAAVDALASSLAKREVLLCVGLGRAWSPRHDPPDRHWMQVNNVFLRP